MRDSNPTVPTVIVRAPALAALLVTGVITGVLGATNNARAGDDDFTAAVEEFDAASKALPTTAPCDTMCQALQSMVRAANRICELARDGNATEQKRCSDARAKVADATARVRASCPNCDPSPPYAPSTTEVPGATPKPTAEGNETTGVDKGPMPAPAPMDDARPRESLAYAAGVASRGRISTVSLDVLPFFTPPLVAQLRFERSVSRRFSFAIVGAYGSLPKTGPTGTGRTPVFGVGGEVRGYVFGGFDGFGLFLGADLMFRNASDMAPGEYLQARMFPTGLTAGALVGTKLVLPSGLTLEARVGPSFVLDDRRGDGPRPRVLPNGGVSLGWTF